MATRKKAEAETHESDEMVEPRQLVEDLPTSSVGGSLEALRKQAQGLRQAAVDKVTAAKEALHSAEAELEEIESFMGMQKPAPSYTPRTPRAPSASTGRTNAPRGFWRGKILEALEGNPDGLKKAELVEACGVTGDLKQIANLSSALQTLKKANEVGQTEDGRYVKP